MMINSANTQQWHEEDKLWSWMDGGLTDIPNTIPARALEVMLLRNNIEVIPAGSFRHLSVCKELNLGENKMHTLQIGAWDGLDRLQILGIFLEKLSLSNYTPS